MMPRKGSFRESQDTFYDYLGREAKVKGSGATHPMRN